MRGQVRLIDRDCLPSDHDGRFVTKTSWWVFLLAVVVVSVFAAILG